MSQHFLHRKKSLLLFGATLLFALPSCSEQHTELSLSSQNSTPWSFYSAEGLPHSSRTLTPWQKKRWVVRVAQRLSANRLHLSPSEIDNLAVSSEDQALDQLFKNPYLAEALTYWGLDFLGQPQNSIRTQKGTFDSKPLGSAPTAYYAALRANGGERDFFESLFSNQVPLYQAALANPFGGNPKPDELIGLWTQEVTRLLLDLDALIQQAKTSAPKIPPHFCASGLAWILGDSAQKKKSLLSLLPPAIQYDAQRPVIWMIPITLSCQNTTLPYPNLVPQLENLSQKLTVFFKRLQSLNPATYRPKEVTELQGVDLSDLDHPFGFFNYSLSRLIPNTTTNLNRKRAAYILRQFFCDDLTPLPLTSLPTPSATAPAVHGDEASCMACHYKLDPMAGLFRIRSLGLLDLTAQNKIIFDDGGTTSPGVYGKNWLAPPSAAPRVWETGYVRSNTDPSLNLYKEDPNDLVPLLLEAPEVKACYVRRLFNHFVSETQHVDTGYLQSLVNAFAQLAPKNSTEATLQTIRALLKSEAFKAENPDPNQCYDFSPGGASSSAPCSIGSLVTQYCLNCHDSQENHLDMSKWIPLTDGKLGFDHRDSTGALLSKQTSFQSLIDRLTQTDMSKRMPLHHSMPDQDRAALFQAFTEESAK